MQLSSDLIMNHPLWEKAEEVLIKRTKIFNRVIDIFIIACSIGIKEDKQIPNEDIDEDVKQTKTIGRNTYLAIGNSDLSDILNHLLQNAIISSNNLPFDINERLKLAFNPDYDNPKFSPANFLVSFANYGITKLFENIKEDLPDMSISDDIYSYLNTLCDSRYEELISGITLEELKSN